MLLRNKFRMKEGIGEPEGLETTPDDFPQLIFDLSPHFGTHNLGIYIVILCKQDIFALNSLSFWKEEGDVIFKLLCSEYRMNLLRICKEIC